MRDGCVLQRANVQYEMERCNQTKQGKSRKVRASRQFLAANARRSKYHETCNQQPPKGGFIGANANQRPARQDRTEAEKKDCRTCKDQPLSIFDSG